MLYIVCWYTIDTDKQYAAKVLQDEGELQPAKFGQEVASVMGGREGTKGNK